MHFLLYQKIMLKTLILNKNSALKTLELEATPPLILKGVRILTTSTEKMFWYLLRLRCSDI